MAACVVPGFHQCKLRLALTFPATLPKLDLMLRRQLLLNVSAMLAAGGAVLHGTLSGRRLGLVIHSYSNRWQGKHSSIKHPPFHDVLDVMDHGIELGIGSLQIGMQGWSLDLAQKARASSESYNMKLEGSIRLPQAPGDVDRFTHELRLGREAGASIFRTAAGGRRYEIFTQRADFEHWKAGIKQALELAEPVARRLGAQIAVENHKDFETTELLEIIKAISSPQIGVCLDTGNSLALLESPLTVVQQLAPYTLTVHLKDIAVHLTEDGFEMAEVPLGQGMLELPEMIRVIQTGAPMAEFHLEMITRDPLSIRCLSESYWPSFPNKPGVELARTLALVRQRQIPKLPEVSSLPFEARLALEEKNIIDSIVCAGGKLGFRQIPISARLREE